MFATAALILCVFAIGVMVGMGIRPRRSSFDLDSSDIAQARRWRRIREENAKALSRGRAAR